MEVRFQQVVSEKVYDHHRRRVGGMPRIFCRLVGKVENGAYLEAFKQALGEAGLRASSGRESSRLK